jgi:hypothetical protein
MVSVTLTKLPPLIQPAPFVPRRCPFEIDAFDYGDSLRASLDRSGVLLGIVLRDGRMSNGRREFDPYPSPFDSIAPVR